MGRLIDAEQLVMHLSDYALQESPGWGSDDWGNKAAYDAISNCILAVQEAPTVEAVAVVKCRDCKHRPAERYYADGDKYVEGPRYQETLKNGLTITLEDETCPCVNGWDSYFSYVPKDDWFCANGERRDDE